MLIRDLARQAESCGDLYAAANTTVNNHLENQFAGIRGIDE
jgi:hypothetical protein